VTDVDQAFAAVCAGDERAFADWMGRVERPLRLSLGPYARAVDVEGVVQETLMRMWLYARDRGAGLTGENASLRFAIGMARNLARNEARRLKREVLLPVDGPPEVPVAPDPPPDPGLARAIADCLERLAARPLEALRARLDLAPFASDREIAGSVGMTLNTFLQNIVRARRQMAECLEDKGVPRAEFLS
jgi:DNA-directed RNA polymerase specialized sigma24 family protein